MPFLRSSGACLIERVQYLDVCLDSGRNGLLKVETRCVAFMAVRVIVIDINRLSDV